MSSLPTKGRVLIQTTVGDIEVELWAKVDPMLSSTLSNSDSMIGNPISMPKLSHVGIRRYHITRL